MNDFMRKGLRGVRRVAIGVFGMIVVLVGVIMIFLPGPGMVVIPAGLAILATEFTWARSLLEQFKAKAGKFMKNFHRESGVGK